MFVIPETGYQLYCEIKQASKILFKLLHSVILPTVHDTENFFRSLPGDPQIAAQHSAYVCLQGQLEDLMWNN